MKNKIYDLICIGNYTKDTIVKPSGISYVDGGAVNYSAHAAVRLGYSVAAVTHLAQEDDKVVKKFQQDGIDCFPTFTAHSTLMRLEYPTENPDLRTLSVTATAGSIKTVEVQDLQSRSAVIGPSIRGEVGLDVIRMLKGKNIQVAVDVQGYTRVVRDQVLINEPWDEMEEYLAQIDVLKADAVEAEFLTGESDIYKAAAAFSALGPKEIVLTHKNGVLILADGTFYDRTFYAQNLSGRSGRGDTCVGVYLASRQSMAPEQASIWAAAVTSLKMETPGPFNRTIAEVEHLIKTRYNGPIS
jgi:sugar/nucleoside kinase (ribokinase family)